MKLLPTLLAAGGLAAILLVFYSWSPTSIGTEPSSGHQAAERLRGSVERVVHAAEPPPAKTNKLASYATLPTSLGVWGKNAEELLMLYEGGTTKEATLLQKLLARDVLEQCMPLAMNMAWPTLDSFVGSFQRQSNDARSALKARCAPFMSVSLDRMRRDYASLLDSIHSPESKYGDVVNTLPRNPTPARVKDFSTNLALQLASVGPEAMVWLQGAVLDWLTYAESNAEAALGLPPSLRNAPHKNSVVLISSCYLSFDCSVSSLAYLSICASSGRCGNGLESAVLASIPEGDRQLTVSNAKLLANIIQRRAVADLGL